MNHHEMVDQIYDEYRYGVDREINEVDSLFLTDLSRDRVAGEIELTNLLFEKENAMEQI